MFSTSNTSTISSETPRRPSTGFGIHLKSVGNHEEVQHQRQPYPSHQKPLWQGHSCSPLQQQHRRQQTTVGVRQGCLLSPTLFNIFLERIMTDALQGHEGTVSIGGRSITNLRFADDIDGWAGEEEELANLVEHLDKASTAYSIEICAEKTKLMTNNASGITQRSKRIDRSLRQSQASNTWAQL